MAGSRERSSVAAVLSAGSRDFWRSLETNSGRAQALGTYEVFHGDWQKLFQVPDRYEAVTREQVQKVAAKVFARNNRSVGVLVPEAAADEAKKEAAR